MIKEEVLLMTTFELYEVVNACFMGKDYTSNICSFTDRPSHGFVYFREGDNIYTFKSGKSIHVTAGDFFYLPKYSNYSFKRNIKGDVYCINLQCNDDIFNNADPDESAFRFSLKRNFDVENIYKKVIREMYLKKPYYELSVKSLVYQLVSIILTEKDSEYTPMNLKTKLLPALNMIDEHYLDNDLSVPYLASICNVSETYFRKLFNNCFGVSPVKYINEKKIKYASDFLKSGLYNVSETASLTGFNDVGYFSRLYKKIIGEMPSQTKN